MYRTKTCGELNIKNVGETVELAGWVQKIRNLGAMIFIDLRDQFGITQIVQYCVKSFERCKYSQSLTVTLATFSECFLVKTSKLPKMFSWYCMFLSRLYDFKLVLS